MPDEILRSLIENYGPVGLSWAALLTAIVVLWKRLNKERDDVMALTKQYAEDTRQGAAALVELTMFIRGKQK